MHILLITSPKLALTFGTFLENKGHTVHYAASVPLGIYAVSARRFDAVLVAAAQPGEETKAACQTLRRMLGPSSLLIAIGQGVSKDALAAGADDFISEPFDFNELYARLVNRTPRKDDEGSLRLCVGDLELDLSSFHVIRRGHQLRLTPVEVKLLRLLMEASPWPVRHRDLQECVEESAVRSTVNQVRSYICRLRNVIDKPFGHSLIQCHPRVGYSIRSPQTEGGCGTP